jgi:uncharacterized integral membrane protein
MQINIILTLIFAIFIALFALVNATIVTVSFLFVQIEVSLALVIIISALFGALVVILFDSFRKIKTNKTIKNLNKKVADLEKENLAAQEKLKTTELEQLKKEEALKEKDQMIETLKASQSETPQNGE